MAKYSYEEAVEKAISQNREVKLTIRKILEWDTSLTIPELAKAYKRSKVATYKFAQKYKLVFHQRRGRRKYELTDKKREIAHKLRSEGYLLKEIGYILGVKHQYISQLLEYMDQSEVGRTPSTVRRMKSDGEPPKS